MIDIEDSVFNRCVEAIDATGIEASVSASYVNRPAFFPSVQILASDNPIDTRYSDSGSVERVATPVFTVQVYADNSNHRGREVCKALMAAVNDRLVAMNFNRTSCMFLDNAEDTSITRYVARFTCATDGILTYTR